MYIGGLPKVVGVPSGWNKQRPLTTPPHGAAVKSAHAKVSNLVLKWSENLDGLKRLKPVSVENKGGQNISPVSFKKVTQDVENVIKSQLLHGVPCSLEIDPTTPDNNPLATIFANSKPSETLTIMLVDQCGYVLVERVKKGMQETYSLYRSVANFVCNEKNIPKASSLKDSFPLYGLPPKYVLKELRARIFSIVSDHTLVTSLKNLLNDDYAKSLAAKDRDTKDEVMSWAWALTWAIDNSLANKTGSNGAKKTFDVLNPLLPGQSGRTFDKITTMFEELRNLLDLKTSTSAVTGTMTIDEMRPELRQLTTLVKHAVTMERKLGPAVLGEIKLTEQYETTQKNCELEIASCRDKSVKSLSEFMFRKSYTVLRVYNDTTQPMPDDVKACLKFDAPTKLYEPLERLLELLESKITEIRRCFDETTKLRKFDALKKLPDDNKWMKKEELLKLARKESILQFNATQADTLWQKDQVTVIEFLHLLCGGKILISEQLKSAYLLLEFIKECGMAIYAITNDCLAIRQPGDLAAMLNSVTATPESVVKHLSSLTWINETDLEVITSLVELASIPESILLSKEGQHPNAKQKQISPSKNPTELSRFATDFVIHPVIAQHQVRDYHQRKIDDYAKTIYGLSRRLDPRLEFDQYIVNINVLSRRLNPTLDLTPKK